jgi:hypothetical protein
MLTYAGESVTGPVTFRTETAPGSHCPVWNADVELPVMPFTDHALQYRK